MPCTGTAFSRAWSRLKPPEASKPAEDSTLAKIQLWANTDTWYRYSRDNAVHAGFRTLHVGELQLLSSSRIHYHPVCFRLSAAPVMCVSSCVILLVERVDTYLRLPGFSKASWEWNDLRLLRWVAEGHSTAGVAAGVTMARATARRGGNWASHPPSHSKKLCPEIPSHYKFEIRQSNEQRLLKVAIRESKPLSDNGERL